MSQLEIEKRNLQSSLLFMQQEHSNTLKALHEEIGKLQKKCTDLTFELTMWDDSTEDEEHTTRAKDKKIIELQNLLVEQEVQQKRLEKEMASKEDLVADLNRQLRQRERKSMEELKQRDQQVLALKVELNNKGSTIAYLTTELHKIKVLQQKADGAEASNPIQTGDYAVKRRTKRLTSASDIKSRPVTAKGTMPRHDVKVFLAQTTPDEVEEEVTVKPTPPVLPPITGDENGKKAFNRRQQLLRRRLVSPPEYSKLAVEKLVQSNSNTWVHEPNTTK